MDDRHFDALTRTLSSPDTRRRLLGLLLALPLLGGLLAWLDPEQASARDRRRRRKGRHKKRRNKAKGKRRRTQRRRTCKPQGKGKVCAGQCGTVKNRQTCGKPVDCGPCPCDPPCTGCQTCDVATQTCVPTCSATEVCCDATCADLQTNANHCGACGNACAEGQVCQGGVCGVACGGDFCPAASEICVDEVCELCDVTCTGSAVECGAALQEAIDGGGNVYVCPGRYLRPSGFEVTSSDTPGIYGAGSGTDPASNTILDRTGGTAPVLTVSGGGTAILSGLRVTGGNGGVRPGGIWNEASILTMENCAIVGNTSAAAAGGGLYSGGPLRMFNSLVADNTCTGAGPGGLVIMYDDVGTDSAITNSVIDNNTGGQVGGIWVSLTSATQSLIIDSASQITNNTANGPTIVAGGIANLGAGTVSAIGATVTGNTTPQCVDVDGC